MDIYNHLINSKSNLLKYFGKKNICFLDIETTGLSRKYNQIYLIGMVYFDENNKNWCLKQIFANNTDQEKQILEKLNNIINQFDLIVTYNGISFDLPFIHHRCKKHSIHSKILDMNNFDIYREIKNHSSYIQLENLRLKTVEEKLGIYREDEYSGKDCINFYYQYMKNKDEVLKNRILKHNYDDLYYLMDIMKIFDHIRDIKSTVVDYNGKIINIEIKDIIASEDILKISCTTSTADDYVNAIYYQGGFNIDWRGDNSLVIDLEFKEGLITPTKKCLFLYKADIPYSKDLNDLSQFIVPDNIILLKVEDKYEVENIKNILKHLIQYVLLEQDK